MLKKRFVLIKLHYRPNQGIDFTGMCPSMGSSSSALKTNPNTVRLFHCSFLLFVKPITFLRIKKLPFQGTLTVVIALYFYIHPEVEQMMKLKFRDFSTKARQR